MAASAPARNGADEEQLVEGICTPGGLRAQPDREHLRLFVESAAGVSGQRIAQLLQAKIVRRAHLALSQLAVQYAEQSVGPLCLCVQRGSHMSGTLVPFVYTGNCAYIVLE